MKTLYVDFLKKVFLQMDWKKKTQFFMYVGEIDNRLLGDGNDFITFYEINVAFERELLT